MEDQPEGSADVCPAGVGIYDSNPNHLWNRIHHQFFARKTWDGKEYGEDELDPLLRTRTRYLLEGPSHQRAIRLLDEFLTTNGERLIAAPVKRAVMQHDMVAIFDWLASDFSTYQQSRTELKARIGRVIQRLALASEQIQALPDTYSAAVASGGFPGGHDARAPQKPFLPPDLFAANGPWVCLRGKLDPSAAIAHREAFRGRSVFLVFIRLPGGRQRTIEYLKRLDAFSNFFVPQADEFDPLLLQPDGTGVNAPPGARKPNPRLPQFPAGTMVALVRQMVLINNQGEMVPTHLTESVQIRVFPAIPSQVEWHSHPGSALQDVFEFKFSRARLFSCAAGGLKPVSENDPMIDPFISSGPDEFDESQTQRDGANYTPILSSCALCHSAPGIHSMIATRVIFNRQPTAGFSPSTPHKQAEADIHWRGEQEWSRALRAYWIQSSR